MKKLSKKTRIHPQLLTDWNEKKTGGYLLNQGEQKEPPISLGIIMNFAWVYLLKSWMKK